MTYTELAQRNAKFMDKVDAPFEDGLFGLVVDKVTALIHYVANIPQLYKLIIFGSVILVAIFVLVLASDMENIRRRVEDAANEIEGGDDDE